MAEFIVEAVVEEVQLRWSMFLVHSSYKNPIKL